MKKTASKYRKKTDMMKVMSNPRYRGRHIIVVGGKVFSARTGERAGEILEMLHEKYPKETPEIAYVPKAETLILVVWR